MRRKRAAELIGTMMAISKDEARELVTDQPTRHERKAAGVRRWRANTLGPAGHARALTSQEREEWARRNGFALNES